jgi:prephenate dehydrogenase
VGLIGGSVGLAVKARRLFREVRGTTRSSSSLERALKMGAIDKGFRDAREAAEGAEFVVVATSVTLIPRLCLQAAETAADGAVITDVGSVKGAIAARLAGKMPARRHYVGSHPLAGSEKRGVANASADLLAGATCIVAAAADADTRAFEQVSGFWQALGMKVFRMTPGEHDAILATVSHLPHLVAAALVRSIPDSALPFGASGLRDTTRVAAGDAALWREIIEANQDKVLTALEAFGESVAALKGHILRRDWEGLEAYLAKAAEKRHKRYGEIKGEDWT